MFSALQDVEEKFKSTFFKEKILVKLHKTIKNHIFSSFLPKKWKTQDLARKVFFVKKATILGKFCGVFEKTDEV